MVYLIHFDTPFYHCRHYLGYASKLDRRLAHHKRGTGSRLLRAVNEAGIGWQVVRTWEGDGNLEQELKKRKNSRKLCPICNTQSGGTS